MSRKQERLALLALFLVMAVLQITVAARQCLWGDEIFSVAIATGHSLEQKAAAARPPLGDFVEQDHPVPAAELRRYLRPDNPPACPARVVRAVLLSDTSPPLYYLLLSAWTLIVGSSDFLLRLFSVAWSLASFPLMAAVARMTGGRRAVLPSCFLLALSPIGLYFASEVRMYSLLIFLVLALMWTILVLQRRGGGWGLYALWAGISAAGFLTHYFFLFPWLATVAFLVIHPGKINRTRLLLFTLGMAMVLLPWYLNFSESMAGWRVTQGWLKLRPKNFHRLRAVRSLFAEFFSGDGYGLWPTHPKAAHAALLLFAVLGGATLWRFRSRLLVGRRLLLWLWFFAACGAPVVMDFVQGTYSVNVPRYALAALPAAYLIASLGLAYFRVTIRWAILLLIGVAWAFPIGAILHKTSRNLQPLNELARTLDANSNSSDVILIHSIPSGYIGTARYMRGPAPLASWVQQLGRRRVPESIYPLISGRKRVIMVKVHTAGAPAPEEDWLREYAGTVQQTRLQGITITAFRPKSGETF